MPKGMVYLDVRDHVNKYTYRLHDVPATYGPVQTYFLRKDSPGPLYVPTPREHYSCDYTIASMVDMYFNKVRFTFDSTDQMKEVFRYLNAYIATMEEETNLDLLSREQKEYFQRAVSFRNSMIPRIERILKKEVLENSKKRSFLNTVRSTLDQPKRRMR